jgi:hypothetical protein
VLLFAEQGLGDTIQFIRYAPMVRDRGGVVLVECPATLERLLKRCPGIDRVTPQGAPLPEFAFQIPLMSLPGVFHTTLNTVPADVPYLSAEPGLIDAWEEELAAAQGVSPSPPTPLPRRGEGRKKVGIVWQGSQRYAGDAHRSIKLKEFAPLAHVPGVQLVRLQKEFGAEQLRDVPDWNVLDLGDQLRDFADTAAVMQHLDLVITVDTAVAHLAGALGVPVWIALSVAADWRWMRGPDRSPWYPSVRLFRQTQWGDWGGVMRRMADELRRSNFAVRSPLHLGPLAPAELIERITLLEIRRNRELDEPALDRIGAELGTLRYAMARSLKDPPELGRLTAELRSVSEELCRIEEEVVAHEKRADFDDRFVELARCAFQLNGARSRIKEQINRIFIVGVAEGNRQSEKAGSNLADSEPVPIFG